MRQPLSEQEFNETENKIVFVVAYDIERRVRHIKVPLLKILQKSM